ncbi:MAG TPA: AAA family ATPase, partial [Deinococcales bacterium]|nr:AAA family ATPase [Deinococcales bacterium]
MAFLEREPQLATLESLLREASGGQGRLAFVGGEAGVGKSSLVARFCAASAGEVRVAAVGACDPVSSRQALAPLLDVAGALGGEVPGLIARPEDRDRLFRAVLERLSAGSRPTLLVLEDVHWGDDATLDLLRYLGRRVGAARALLLATYRDDEVGPLHPLRVVLGDLATSPDVRRLALSRLSEGAVRELAAGSGLDARELHRRTGGNPFYV